MFGLSRQLASENLDLVFEAVNLKETSGQTNKDRVLQETKETRKDGRRGKKIKEKGRRGGRREEREG